MIHYRNFFSLQLLLSSTGSSTYYLVLLHICCTNKAIKHSRADCTQLLPLFLHLAITSNPPNPPQAPTEHELCPNNKLDYLNLSQLLESCRSCHLLTTSLCGISDSNHPSYTCYGWSSQDECHLDEVLAIQCNLWDIQVTSFMHGWLIHSSLFPLPNDGRGCDGYPILSTS